MGEKNKKKQKQKANKKDAGNNQWTSATADITNPLEKKRERRDGPGGEDGRAR